MNLFGLMCWQDYEGGGYIGIFSTLEKAKEFGDTYKLSVTESLTIDEIKLDNPSYVKEVEGYYRRG